LLGCRERFDLWTIIRPPRAEAWRRPKYAAQEAARDRAIGIGEQDDEKSCASARSAAGSEPCSSNNSALIPRDFSIKGCVFDLLVGRQR